MYVYVSYVCLHTISLCLDDCTGKECGVPCNERGDMLCDGKGECVDGLRNPCAKHGCEGLKCGDSCLYNGDLIGKCDYTGKCIVYSGKCIYSYY